MGLGESIRVALDSLRANKLRSALTMLGMIIGVGAVITLMSIGQGAQASVAAQFKRLGTNLVFVDPGTTRSGGVILAAGSTDTLTSADATAIANPDNCSACALVAPELHIPFPLQFIYHGQQAVGTVMGTTPEYSQVHNYQVAEGGWITDTDMQSRAKNAVLGANVARDLFGSTDPIGKLMTLGFGRHRFAVTVEGVGEAKGGAGFNNPDNEVYIPLTTMQQDLYHAHKGSSHNVVSHITVQAVSAKQENAAAQQVSELLYQRHQSLDPTDPNDFSVTTQEDQIQTRQQISQTLTIFLAAVAGISLVVGGIGIMNIMLVSVTERTREIGIRKAVGARRQDILMQFLTEAFTVSILGGAGGIVAGVGIAALINGHQLNGSAMETVVTTQSIVLATGVAAAIGLFFGAYPASRASRLSPIEALRYE
jgi:putative ABC transport system permease protein